MTALRWLRRRKTQILLLLSVVGPGIITANVDNDAGGILTYSQAGAQFGYSLLWTMLPVTLALIVVQEMCSRMGAVTGKGLSDLIREEFGLRITFFLMIALVLTNFGNVVSEFAGKPPTGFTDFKGSGGLAAEAPGADRCAAARVTS